MYDFSAHIENWQEQSHLTYICTKVGIICYFRVEAQVDSCSKCIYLSSYFLTGN